MRPDPPSEADPGLVRRTRAAGLATFVLALLPALAAIWAVPLFVTQDGPAHLYNAHILAESLAPRFAVPRLLRGALAAAAELGGAPGADGAGRDPAAAGGRPRDDDGDAGRLLGRDRLAALAGRGVAGDAAGRRRWRRCWA